MDSFWQMLVGKFKLPNFTAKPKDTFPFIIKLTENNFGRLHALKLNGDYATSRDLYNEALHTLEWFVEQYGKGRGIFSVDGLQIAGKHKFVFIRKAELEESTEQLKVSMGFMCHHYDEAPEKPVRGVDLITEITPDNLDRIHALMEVGDFRNRDALFTQALTSLEWAVNECNKGRKVVAVENGVIYGEHQFNYNREALARRSAENQENGHGR